MLLEFLAHADAGIRTGKAYPRLAALTAQLLQGDGDGAVVLVVFDSVAHNVHHEPLDVHRAADKLGVGQGNILADDFDAAPGGLLFQHVPQAGEQLDHIERPVLQDNLAGFQLAHVQNLVDKLQQQAGGVPDFAAALGLLVRVIAVMVANLHHAAYAVDGRADIVAHPLQELSLGHIGGLGLVGGLLQLNLVGALLAQVLGLIAAHCAAAHQLNEQYNHQIGHHNENHIFGRGLKDGLLRQIGADIEPTSLHKVAEPAALPETVLPDVEHFIIAAALLNELQRGHLAGGKPAQGVIVGGQNGCAVRPPSFLPVRRSARCPARGYRCAQTPHPAPQPAAARPESGIPARNPA